MARGARKGSIAHAPADTAQICFPRSITPLCSKEREPGPWNTSRQAESFPRRRVYPKKPQWPCRKAAPAGSERPLRELGREPNPTTALSEHSLWWGLHHSAPSPAGLCSTFSFYGAGTGLQHGGMWDPCRKPSVSQTLPPKGLPRQLRDVPWAASLLPSRLTQSFLPSNTDSERLSVEISDEQTEIHHVDAVTGHL